MAHPALAIVIPAYNEGSVLSTSIPAIDRCVASVGLTYELIIIDDGSLDDTWAVLSDLAVRFPALKGIRLSRNFGKELAIAAGLEFARGDAVIVMDGDLQHPPELIPEMVRHWMHDGADIVEAVKEDRGKEAFSKVRARLFYAAMRRLTDLNLENASDYKLLDRKVVNAHNRLPENTRFFRGIVSWLGFRKVQLPFAVQEGIRGKTRWSPRQLLRLAINASTAFSSIPLHLVTLLGAMTFAISIIIGLHTIYMKMSGGAVSGFSTVIILLLSMGSIIMMSLGIIGLYISRIFDEVKRRPKYIVQETTSLGEPDR
jgi:glycosyltransferase involved in cell wall biosynthesis